MQGREQARGDFVAGCLGVVRIPLGEVLGRRAQRAVEGRRVPLGLSIPGLDGRPMPGTASRLILGDKILTNRLVPLITDQGDAISWLTDRLAGKSTTSNCWKMPIQP